MCRAHPALRTSFEFDGAELWTLEHPAAARPLAVQSTSLASAVETAEFISNSARCSVAWFSSSMRLRINL